MGTLIDGQGFRALRRARGWDQKTLADKAGVDPSLISRLERGLQDNVTTSALVGLAQTFDVPVDALLVPYRDQPSSSLVHELEVVVSNLPNLSPENQRLVAAILWGCLSALSGAVPEVGGTEQ